MSTGTILLLLYIVSCALAMIGLKVLQQRLLVEAKKSYMLRYFSDRAQEILPTQMFIPGVNLILALGLVAMAYAPTEFLEQVALKIRQNSEEK